MIYTIGHTETYLQCFATNGALMKKGRDNDYCGGSVWQSYQEAAQFAPPDSGYSVFGVMADWKTETEPSEDGDWHDLLVDANLVILEKK